VSGLKRRDRAEIHGVLADGGRLILTMDNPVNPVVAVRNALPFNWVGPVGLVPYYVGPTCGPRKGQRLLEAEGFDVVETGAILHCPRAIAVAWASRLSKQKGRTRHRFLEWLRGWERLELWPTRYVTGHFVAWMAVKDLP